MAAETIEIIVRGKVQGVFYRATANEKARELDITGTARNMPDGTVLLIATGSTEQLIAFKDWCWEGSENAIVTHVESRPIPYTWFEDFRTVR